ncbi:MAG: hypothetical protein QXI55_04395 [Thermofilum sp.]
MEKVRKVLETVGVKDIKEASRAQVAVALGRLLSVKISERPSVHEVTKEVRRALEIVARNPLREDLESAITSALYTTPPFGSAVLNEAYRLLLGKLLRDTAELVEKLGPMWRKRVVNLTVENIYNAAVTERWKYRDEIFKILGVEGAQTTAEEVQGEAE